MKTAGLQEGMGMPHILIVDDGALVTSWLSELLRREGYDVETAHDEHQAVRLYGEARHDLVVADLLMPNSLGMDFVTQLLRHNPQARILAIAGSELVHSGSQWNAASVFGSVRVLRKPFSLAAFLRIVKEQLSQEHQVTEPIL